MFENFAKEMNLTIPKTQFTGYEKLQGEGRILALFNQQAKRVTTLQGEGYLILDQTPLFAMSGGQDSDRGTLFFKNHPIALQDLKKDVLDGYFLHAINTNEQTLNLGDSLVVVVDAPNRQWNSIHHSALHLTWETLLKCLNHDVPQIGSKVTPEKHVMQLGPDAAITPVLIDSIIQQVNTKVFPQGLECKIFWVSQAEAQAKKWLFEFTKIELDKKVRMVGFGDYAFEACSGTHVQNTNQIPTEYFLDYDKSPKRIMVTSTCNPEFAKKWFLTKNQPKYEEILGVLEKLQKMGFPKNLKKYEVEACKLVNQWSFLATQSLNQLLQEVTKIANDFAKKQEQVIQEQYANLKLEPTTIKNFLIYQTTNKDYTNKILLKTAINLANNNQEKVIILINTTDKNINTVIIRNRNLNFDLKLWSANWLKNTSFKGGINPSMLQLISSDISDLKNLIDYLK